MNMEKRIAVYPYNYEFTPFLRYGHLNLNCVSLFSPKSWSLCGKDASAADGGIKLGINVSSENKKMDECDILIVPEYRQNDQIDDIVVDLLMKYMNMQKPIYYMSSNKKIIPTIINEYEHFNISSPIISYKEYIDEKKLQEINTPIIVICGLMSNINKFDVLYVTSNQLEEMGYTCSVISPKPYSGLLAYYDYPSDICNEGYSMYDRTLMFNHYIKRMEQESHPDVIIIEIPNGIMAYNEKIHNNFGYFSNLIFNAVHPDYVCLCLPCTDITNEYIEMLRNLIYYRFNTEIDAFYYSNKQIDSKPYLDDDSIASVIYDYDILFDKLYKITDSAKNYDIYNFFNTNDISRYINQILMKLGK